MPKQRATHTHTQADMAKVPYLHPSQRNLRTEQVGPSSHQNEYHVGVLQGNWVEERIAFGQQAVPVKLDSLTVSRASYQPPPKGGHIKDPPVRQNETPRHLLFGHGTDLQVTSFATVAELSFADTTAADNTIPKGGALGATAASRSNLVAKKKAKWQEDNDPDLDNYVSTNKQFNSSASAR